MHVRGRAGLAGMSCSISEYVPRVDSPGISGVHKIPICQKPAAVSALVTSDAASKAVSSGMAAPLTGDMRGPAAHIPVLVRSRAAGAIRTAASHLARVYPREIPCVPLLVR